MTARRLGFWTLQSAAVGLFVAAGSWGLMRWSAPPEQDLVVVRTPAAAPSASAVEDLAWSIRNEGIADALSDTRPDPYIPGEPPPRAPETSAPTDPEAEEPSAAAAAWAAPLTAMLKAKPDRPTSTRSVLRKISLGPAAAGLSFGVSAPLEAAAPGPAAAAFAAQAAPTAEPQPARRAVTPVRRAFVSTAPGPSAPPRALGLADQQGTDYGEADAPTD